MQKLRFSAIVFYGLAIFFLASCSDSVEGPDFDYIISYELADEISEEEIKERFDNDLTIESFISFDVNAYTLTYMTENYDGEMVEASGLVLIPQREGTSSMVSFQHSTLVKSPVAGIDQEANAPSYLSAGNSEMYLSAPLYASHGYIISAADYIGYGSTKDLFHPYEHAETTAKSSFDMLRAAYELVDHLEVKRNDELRLVGYSQGGNATMALHKYIEENHSSEFTITESAMGAGAYHKTALGDYIFNYEGSIGLPMYLYLWVLDSYDRVYTQRGMSYYLKAEYASEVEGGNYTNLSSTDPDVIFSESFLAEVANPESSALYAALADNDIHDWSPQAPIYLYHSRNDDLVPYFNSVDALEAISSNGSEIDLTTYEFEENSNPGIVHGQGGGQFFADVLLDIL